MFIYYVYLVRRNFKAIFRDFHCVFSRARATILPASISARFERHVARSSLKCDKMNRSFEHLRMHIRLLYFNTPIQRCCFSSMSSPELARFRAGGLR